MKAARPVRRGPTEKCSGNTGNSPAAYPTIEAPVPVGGSPTSTGPPRKRSGATPRSCSTATPPYRVRGRLCRTAARCWCGGWTVANHAELITAFCVACAESIGTHQVLCYQRNVGVGEVVGIDTRHKDLAIAA